MNNQLGLLKLSDEELEQVLPDVNSNLDTLARIRPLDLTRVAPARQMKAEDRGKHRD
jgi:hypothetical protein